MDQLIATCSIALPAEPPEWVHLFPVGTVQALDGRGPWHLAADKAPAVIAASADALKVKPIDYDHQTENAEKNGQPAPASGWITELQARADGIWGHVEWTERAAAMIKAREYRFLSPVFGHLKDGTVTRILRAALTNKPAIGELTALASRQGDDLGETMTAEQLKALRAALGLKDDATIEQITAQASSQTAALKARGEEFVAIAAAVGLKADAKGAEILSKVKDATENPDPAKYVAAASFNQLAADFASLQKRINTEAATTAVDAAITAGKIIPAQRDWAVAYASSDLTAFQTYVAATPQIVKPGGTTPDRPPGAGKEKLDAEDLAVCAAMGIAPAEYAKTLGITAAA